MLAVVLGVSAEEVVVGKVILIGCSCRMALMRGPKVRSCLLEEQGSLRVGRIAVLSLQTSTMWGGILLVVDLGEVEGNFVGCSYFAEMGVRS